MFNDLYGKTILMEGSILGFQNLNSFVLIPVDETNTQSPFAYLQSTEEESLGFLVTNPFTFIPSYEVQVQEDEKAALETSDPNDVIVLCIVTLAEPFDNSTLNLLAPLLISIRSMTGRQFVMSNDSRFSTKVPLFSSSSEQEAGEGC
ncbi:flagellar assembly protein FliW [Cohnella sp. WQ 127256]|uniref:flagellar assembly protein FliW n=1 Tax=Cohnella sp. WQ 127256 TaxID=2938790 RepID=UPI0021177499|nr:flagellar assembly protein FliW [Cohnella sp. WQ 127256]